jgi:hypothetical protein
LLLFAMSVIYLLPFVHALPFIDGVRDMQMALGIARGELWPLTGPVFGNRFHLGPVGYYLQALPLWLGLPVSAIPAFLGLIACSKFALAYGLGRDWIDRRYGLLFASALLLPGWSGLDVLNTTTPLLVPALLLIALWCGLRFVRDRTAAALPALALACSLAVHAHPSALVVALFPALACAMRAIRERRWGLLALAIAAALLPLLPALYALARSGWGAVLSDAVTVVVPGSGHSVQGWLEAARGFALGGPLTTLRTLGSAEQGYLWAGLTLAVSGTGLLRLVWVASIDRDRRALGLGLALMIVAVLVFGARSNTPWYFLHPLSLVWAAACAYGWYRGAHGSAIFVSAAIGLGALQSFGLFHHLARGEGSFATIELLDIRQAHGERGPVLGPWISLDHWSALGALLCADAPARLALHGWLAAVVDDQGALAARAQCSVSELRLGGAADRHWIGLPRQLWSPLNWSPESKIGSLGLFRSGQVIAPTKGQLLADPRNYPLRSSVEAAPQWREYSIPVTAGGLLTVSRLSVLTNLVALELRTATGSLLSPVYQDAIGRAYLLEPGAELPWTLRVQSTAPEWVDIVLLAPQHSPP